MNKLGLVIFGTGSNAEVMYDYFKYERSLDINNKHNNPYHDWMTKGHYPIAFTKDGPEPDETFYGLPVVPFDKVDTIYPPDKYEMFIAIGSAKLNHVRAEKYNEAKKKGYELASFISPHSYVGRNVQIGDNCVIMEENNIQSGCKIGNNTVLWSGSHIGHNATIGNHVFMASHIIVAGYCKIEDYVFLGGGVIFAENVTVGNNTLIGAGCYLARDIEGGKYYTVKPTKEGKPFERLGDKGAIYAPPKECWNDR
jgi:sugar O-acyltransferase (sialic acid O-acetyltransferase NeuD family)